MSINIHHVGYNVVRIDNKHRFSIPASIRGSLDKDAEYLIRINQDGFLEIGQRKDFKLLSDNFAQYAAPFYARFRGPDDDGRAVMPQNLFPLLGLKENEDKLVVFGFNKTFGVCAKSKWPALSQLFIERMKTLSNQRHPE